MLLIKQFAKDIYKSLVWLLAFGILVSLSCLSFLHTAILYSLEAGKPAAFQSFVEANVIFLKSEPVEFNSQVIENLDLVRSPRRGKKGQAVLREYLSQAFGPAGKLGTCAFTQAYIKNQPVNLVIFLGQYTALTACEMPADKLTLILASYDAPEFVGQELKLNGESAEISGLAPNDMTLPDPNFYLGPQNSFLQKTIFVLTQDFSWFRASFPGLYSLESYLNGLIAVDPTEAELAEIRNMFLTEGDLYLRAEKSSELLGKSQLYYQSADLYLLFYLAISASFIGFMIFTIASRLDSNMMSYQVHFLFGAPPKHIFARMLLLALSFFVLPLAYILQFLSKNKLLNFVNLGASLLTVAILTLPVCFLKYRSFKLKFTNTLRRD